MIDSGGGRVGGVCGKGDCLEGTWANVRTTLQRPYHLGHQIKEGCISLDKTRGGGCNLYKENKDTSEKTPMGKILRGKGGDHTGVGRRVPQQKGPWQCRGSCREVREGEGGGVSGMFI